MSKSDFQTDTICALATPKGRGALCVVRLSGPQAIDILSKIWQGKKPSEWESHTVHFGTIIDPSRPNDPLDEGVATLFHSPNSYTGEDVVELSLHGSPYIRREILALLIRQGARMAEPGEFTRRAFANGRLDLARAEAVADVIAAQSQAAHRLAHSQMKGKFSERLEQLRQQLLTLASLMELELDFSEEDVEFADRQRLVSLANEVKAEVDRLASSFHTGQAIANGIPVAIVGEPNVGKSSLLNCLLGDDRAIVSDIPGTTRDTVEDVCEISGLTFRFIDTAGLRTSPSDPVELLGINRSRNALAKARVVLWVVTPSDISNASININDPISNSSFGELSNLIPIENSLALSLKALPLASEIAASLSSGKVLFLVINKTDTLPKEDKLSSPTLLPTPPPSFTKKNSPFPKAIVNVSALTGRGIEELKSLLGSKSLSERELNSDDVVVSNLRHYEALTNASSSLSRLLGGLSSDLPTDLVAQDLREALHHLASITGSITTPAILSSIFKNFCVGK